MSVHLSPDQLARDLALPDLTDRRSAGPHAIQLLVDARRRRPRAARGAATCAGAAARASCRSPTTTTALGFTADAASQ